MVRRGVRYPANPESQLGSPGANSESVSRLREAVAEAGGPSHVSRVAGVPLRTLQRYLSGAHAMKMGPAVKLAHATDVNVAWLYSGEGKKRPEGGTLAELAGIAPQLVPVPYYADTEAAAGAGAVVGETHESPQFIAFDEPWLRRSFGVSPRTLALMPANGNSMEPTIRSGEILLFDHSENGRRLRDGIFVVRLEGSVVVKRLQPTPGHIVQVTSDNPAFKPYSVSLDAGTDFSIIGQVVFVLRRL